MTTSRSPRRVLQVAYEAACRALLAQRHRENPKKFTPPQLLACLGLKEFLRLDDCGFAAHLDLARLIHLRAVPYFTTAQKAADRLPRGACFLGPRSGETDPRHRLDTPGDSRSLGFRWGGLGWTERGSGRPLLREGPDSVRESGTKPDWLNLG